MPAMLKEHNDGRNQLRVCSVQARRTPGLSCGSCSDTASIWACRRCSDSIMSLVRQRQSSDFAPRRLEWTEVNWNQITNTHCNTLQNFNPLWLGGETKSIHHPSQNVQIPCACSELRITLGLTGVNTAAEREFFLHYTHLCFFFTHIQSQIDEPVCWNKWWQCRFVQIMEVLRFYNFTIL